MSRTASWTAAAGISAGGCWGADRWGADLLEALVDLRGPQKVLVGVEIGEERAAQVAAAGAV